MTTKKCFAAALNANPPFILYEFKNEAERSEYLLNNPHLVGLTRKAGLECKKTYTPLKVTLRTAIRFDVPVQEWFWNDYPIWMLNEKEKKHISKFGRLGE